MRILFIGDIVGRPGRRAVAYWLPRIREKEAPDVVIANAENAAGGLGATPEILTQLQELGIDGFTMGNHTWRKKAIIEAFRSFPTLVRPANYTPGLPGPGSAIVRVRDGRKLGLVNVLGRVFMEPNECPFRAADEHIALLAKETNCILMDVHGEATSEKIAMGWHLEGRCSAVVGTHTHVQTADNWVLPGGTAYISDVGMCGPLFSVIGTDRETVLERFLTGMPRQFVVANGPTIFSAVLIDVDEATGHGTRITRILHRETD
ncbi:MAG: TIGR00282 family metallophosphoesterase [Candidatus Hydrogenedentes bacterium]|nr:TIGR00282 family metallophosphoesterase [Candidatus Hydrogenedentota bacterium]